MSIPPYPDGSHNSPDNQQPHQPPMQEQAQQPFYEQQAQQPQYEQQGPQEQYGQHQGYQQQYGQHQGYQQQYGAGGGAAHASAQKNPYFDFTGYQFRMPTSWPKSAGDALPSVRGGFGKIFKTAHMPMDARIGYWIWLVGCVTAIIAWFFSIMAIVIGIVVSPVTLVFTGMVSLFGEIRWGVVIGFFATMILQLIMLLLQLALTLKLREGSEWARAGLTVITVLTVVYSIILTVAGLESGGGGTVAVTIISILLIAFFWLPQANAWFIRTTEEADRASGMNPQPHS